jgi:hypothetical protein
MVAVCAGALFVCKDACSAKILARGPADMLIPALGFLQIVVNIIIAIIP